MESIGGRFRQAREAKGYTLEQIARDTHIARRFLEALEAEDFSVFPGEPYLVGFMRTYSEYLELDPAESITLYRHLLLQEQPPPTDELIRRGPRIPFGRIAVIVVVVLAVVGGGYLLFTSGLLDRPPGEPSVTAEAGPAGQVIDMVNEIVEQRFERGDRVLLPVGSDRVAVDLVEIDGAGLTVRIGESTRLLRVAEETIIDLNDDGQGDLRVIVRRLDTADSPPGVVMRLDRGAAAAVPVGVVAAAPAEPTAVQVGPIGSTNEPSRVVPVRLIAEFPARAEFQVEVNFTGYSLFRYEADGGARVERYYQSGQSLAATARDQFKLWISNAAAARVRIAGQDVVLGDPGEVTAALITWVPGEGGRELLELVPVY